MGGTARGRQSVGDRKLTHSGPPARIGRRAGSELPEEGLEPTRTYAQALLRRPRLPFRHSGVPVIVSNASNAGIALTSQTLVWHRAPLAWGDAPSAARVGRPAGGEYIPSTLVGNLLGMFPSKGSNDDRDLVGRARRGDREAFTQLIVQYQVPLYNMALRMVGRPDDAADIAQEAFLRAWWKIRTLREAPFKSWLFPIAANLCYDHFQIGRA